MKKRLTILSILLLFLTGCSVKSGFFSNDELEQSAVINSKRGQIYSSLEIKATIVATYLNLALPEYKKSSNEMFLVSIFIDNDSKNKKEKAIHNASYSLTLNGKKAINIKELKYDNKLIRVLPMRNQWSTYYLVEFEKAKDENLKMIFKSDDYGEVVLKYLKEF